MNVHEALEHWKNLDVSSEDGWLIWQWGFIRLEGKIGYYNSKRRGDRDTDEDSEDENELVPKNLSRSQLLAGATADLSTSSDKILPGAGDEEEVAGLSVEVPSKRNTGLKVYAFL